VTARANGKHNGNGKQERPAQARIDRAKFERYARLQYSNVGMAAEFGVSVDTLERWVEATYGRPVAEVVAEKRELGHNTVRAQLYAKAEKGQPWAVVWYTKNYLGFADKVEETVRGAVAVEPQIWETADGRRIVFRP
jgi:hypothetical protein